MSGAPARTARAARRRRTRRQRSVRDQAARHPRRARERPRRNPTSRTARGDSSRARPPARPARRRPGSGRAGPRGRRVRRSPATRASPRRRSQRPTDGGPRVLGLSLPLLIALEVAAGACVLDRRGRRARRAQGPPSPAPRVRAVRAAPVPARRGQAAGPRGHDRGDRQHRARLPGRPRPLRPAVRRRSSCSTAPARPARWSGRSACAANRASAVALDAAISAAYPDVRLGHLLGEAPRPRPGTFRVPGPRDALPQGAQLRLPARGHAATSSPLRRWRRSRTPRSPSARRPWSASSSRRAPAFFEELARRLYRRHENRLVRQERWGLPEGGLTSTLNRAEMTNAQRTQNRSLFWLETVVAADTPRDLQAARRRRAGPPRREPPAPPLDDRPPQPLPPPLPHRHPAAAALPALRWSPPPRPRTCSSCPPPA